MTEVLWHNVLIRRLSRHLCRVSTQVYSTTTTMGFDIPEPYCYDESFATFYQQIDDEHKGLFQGIFKCAANPGDGAALSSLASAVKTHFTNEEAMMQKANYSEFAAHKPLHTKFLEDLGKLSAPLSADQIKFAKEWLVNHIKGTDFKYKGKL